MVCQEPTRLPTGMSRRDPCANGAGDGTTMRKQSAPGREQCLGATTNGRIARGGSGGVAVCAGADRRSQDLGRWSPPVRLGER